MIGAGIRIEAMTADHADQVLATYQLGTGKGNATFESQAPQLGRLRPQALD
ncbi:L-amino acid N-acyltransferase YncA [Streptacidiphilus sp. MAP12-16]|uniref:hypothetical protein n=1 Tax=Streptacidiphilus sp. MAP12-16 TaxID=3156300 RepID=UPI0035193504